MAAQDADCSQYLHSVMPQGKEGKTGSNFVVGINIYGMKHQKGFSARADLAWDRWLMVSRAFGLKRKADTVLIFFPDKEQHNSVSPLTAMETAASGG